MIKTLIVDDEELARQNLSILIQEFCPDLNVIGTAKNKNDAEQKINDLSPDVVFLDIRMPSGAEGLDLLLNIKKKDFLVVFVTAFKDYAVKAFASNAIHYILKPIDIEELLIAYEKIKLHFNKVSKNNIHQEEYIDSLKKLIIDLIPQKQESRISVPHIGGIKLIDPDEVWCFSADGNCTIINFNDKSKYTDTRTLKYYENILDENKFFRIHKSYIINLSYLKEYVSKDGHYVIMKNGKTLPIARSKIKSFVNKLKF